MPAGTFRWSCSARPDQAAAEEHIAWDIGALALAEELSRRLDAPLLAAGYSRLLIDLNRPLEAPDSIPPHSEVYPVPGNRELSRRCAAIARIACSIRSTSA